ncbi:hypothetical protein [Bacillus sp. FJAT-45350]|uniref:hypothetical protein n=1 Tax=Bacillus sp. FJAT-45350 TaxID=2011014 RepID=UPI000BB80F94|nr:hypothetical protein [Bacillus sp. FJAT-45350]
MTFLLSPFIYFLLFSVFLVGLGFIFSFVIIKILRKLGKENNKVWERVASVLMVLFIAVGYFGLNGAFVHNVNTDDLVITPSKLLDVSNNQRLLTTEPFAIVYGIYREYGYLRDIQSDEGTIRVRMKIDDYRPLFDWHLEKKEEGIIEAERESILNLDMYYEEIIDERISELKATSIDIEEIENKLNQDFSSLTFELVKMN